MGHRVEPEGLRIRAPVALGNWSTPRALRPKRESPGTEG